MMTEHKTRVSDPAILIVEDDALIAVDTETILNEAGWRNITLATTVTQAFAALDTGRYDIVLLDANLKDETSAPVAVELFSRGTKFLVVTGYTHGQLPKAFSRAHVVPKPVEPRSFVKTIRAML